MTQPEQLFEIWRGGHLESQHVGHAVVCNDAGEIVDGWGDPDLPIFPRSSCKMLQAIPLIESGAAEAHKLTREHLALACASHEGAAIHTDRVSAWLADLELTQSAFRCGPQEPNDRAARDALVREGKSPCQIHNNCSGKHAGFLTLGKHLGSGPEYVELDHPVQKAVKAVFEEMTGEVSPGYGIDGCSAPNFMTSVRGLARAMAKMANPTLGEARSNACRRLVEAMMAHPDLVAGEGRACTELMRAANGRVAVKTGAEGVFTAILPESGLGIAVKAADGATRAAEAAIAALLVKYGVLDQSDKAVQKRIFGPITNRREIRTGEMRVNSRLLASS